LKGMHSRFRYLVVFLVLLFTADIESGARKAAQPPASQLIGTWAVANPRFGESWSIEFDPDSSYLASPIPRVAWRYHVQGARLEVSLSNKQGHPIWECGLRFDWMGEKLEVSDPACSVTLPMRRLLSPGLGAVGIVGTWRFQEASEDSLVRCRNLFFFQHFSSVQFTSQGRMVLGATPHCAFRGQYTLGNGSILLSPQDGKRFDAKADYSQDGLKMRIRAGWPRFTFLKIEGSENIPVIQATAEGTLRSCDLPITSPIGSPPWPGPY
jgi:hypothetical protein